VFEIEYSQHQTADPGITLGEISLLKVCKLLSPFDGKLQNKGKHLGKQLDTAASV
jgi:hypothetical protein